MSERKKYRSDAAYFDSSAKHLAVRYAYVGESVLVCTDAGRIVAGVVESLRWVKEDGWVPNVVCVNDERDSEVSSELLHFSARTWADVEEMPGGTWCFPPP